MDKNYPGRILLCEANQYSKTCVPISATATNSTWASTSPIMPRIYMALKKGRRYDDMIEILRRTPPIPENCQWCTFLRNHDELTLEMVTDVWQNASGCGEQYAPIHAGDRTSAFVGVLPLCSIIITASIALANSLLFTLPGSPIIYYGDEIGMGDNRLTCPTATVSARPCSGTNSPMQAFPQGAPFS